MLKVKIISFPQQHTGHITIYSPKQRTWVMHSQHPRRTLNISFFYILSVFCPSNYNSEVKYAPFLIWQRKFYCFFLLLLFVKVFGLMTKPLVRLLMPPPIVNSNVLSSEPSSPNTLPLLHSSQDPESDTEHEDFHRSASLSRIVSTTGNTIHRYWRKYDDRYMRPLFGGREVVHPVPASSTNNDSQ